MSENQSEDPETQLVNKHYGLVVSQAVRLSSQRNDLEDYMQVGFIGLLKAIRNYDPDKSQFSTFATVCIRNEIFRYMRKNKKKPINFSFKKDNWYTTKEELWELIPDCLNEKEKLVLKMKSENYTHKEIAEKLSCPKGQIKHIVRKIIEITRKYYREEKEDTSM
jgi:RNA polymerase sigma factor (sigma-70 family)